MKSALLIFAIVAVLSFLASHNPANLSPPPVPAQGQLITLIPDSKCDPVIARCWASSSGDQASQSLAIHFDQVPHPLKPFDIELHLPAKLKALPYAAMVEFSMLGMDMGVNRFRLALSADGVWRAQVILPVCVTQRSDWSARVSLQMPGEIWVASFPFVMQ